MKRRKPRRAVQRKPPRKPRPQPATPPAELARDADPLADAGLRPLLERYCRLGGVTQAALGPDHAELSLPP